MNLVIKNLDPTTTKEELETYFGEFGQLKSVKVESEKGIAFVCFMERDCARKAKEQCTNKLFKAKTI
jgi:RNA recognition motif-containing protein